MNEIKKNDLEEEMSRFEQEIAGQLPPPPRLPINDGYAEAVPHDDTADFAHHPDAGYPYDNGPMDHQSRQGAIPSFPPQQHNEQQQMLHPFPHLPPLPPLPHGLPVPPSLGNHQSGGNLPQFMPPPMPPMMMNPVAKQSAPVIKPPTVPIDSYDPTQALVEEKHSEPGSSSVGTGGAKSGEKTTKNDRKRKFVRVGGGQTWEDESLAEWDQNDFRLFCGDLGNEVTDEYLYRAFSSYASITRAKVVRDKKSKKTKGYGFVSFKDPQDYLKAMREMNGKYVGNRPIKLRKSTWKDRNIEVSRKKDKEKKKLGLR
eukprot:gene11156-12328_t